MAGAKERPLTREDAKQLYQDLQKSVELLKSRKGGAAPAGSGAIPDATARQIAMEIKAALKKDAPRGASSSRSIETIDQAVEAPRRPSRSIDDLPPPEAWSARGRNRGPGAALSVVVCFALVKMAFSILEYSGIMTVQPAQASYQVQPAVHQPAQGPYSPQELQILTSLDSRRTELDVRNKQLDEREKDIEKRDREFASRMNELRELSSRLKVDREKTEKKQEAQLTQLANVYNSMNPTEAAHLLDQLDEVTAFQLLGHMSEKRIGQILPLMSPERALAMTRALSGKR